LLQKKGIPFQFQQSIIDAVAENAHVINVDQVQNQAFLFTVNHVVRNCLQLEFSVADCFALGQKLNKNVILVDSGLG
jgi:hypothetical protein